MTESLDPVREEAGNARPVKASDVMASWAAGAIQISYPFRHGSFHGIKLHGKTSVTDVSGPRGPDQASVVFTTTMSGSPH